MRDLRIEELADENLRPKGLCSSAQNKPPNPLDGIFDKQPVTSNQTQVSYEADEQ